MSLIAAAATANLSDHDSGTILILGWVSQPDGRGTLDIVQSCALTLLLCTWSVLCLNVPEPSAGRFSFFKYKLWWSFIALAFPEVITGIAGEQWRAATHVREDFVQLGYTHWTVMQAFFVNMGGISLKCPDFPEFPINGQQLSYLVKKYDLKLDIISEHAIKDKDKASLFVRIITVVQVLWFMMQCVGRASQDLGLTTLELTVICNIVGTLISFAFWHNKPCDVEVPIVLHTDITISRILTEAGQAAAQPYSRTPMDFVKSTRTRPNLTTVTWLGLQKMLKRDRDPPGRPVRRIGNTETLPHRDYHKWDLVFFIVFPLTFFGMHLIAWNLPFPSAIESLLWKVSTFSLLYLNIMHYILVYTLIYHPHLFGNIVAGKSLNDLTEIYEESPQWVVMSSHWFGMGVYVFARSYLLIEGWSSLRAQQARIFQSVNWANFVPHV